MLEVYHFANPLASDCLATEMRLQEMVNHLPKARLRFIPLVHPEVISTLATTIDQYEWPVLAEEQDADSVAFRVCLDYKAAQLVGNKKARPFLIALQEKLQNGAAYSDALVLSLAAEIGLDADDFNQYRQASEASDAALADQQLAEDMLPADGSTIAIENNQTMTTHFVNDFTPQGLSDAFQSHFPDFDLAKDFKIALA